MKLALLVRFYPARWRERYGEEIADLLASEPPSVPRAVDMVRGLIDAHLHPELDDSALAAVPAAGERSAEMRTRGTDRKSTRLNSSHVSISYAVFCLKKKI